MKIICVPKDMVALENLHHDSCIEGDLLELVLETEIVEELFSIGFFDKINAIAGSIIDDFEQDGITDDKAMKKIINSNLFDHRKYNERLDEIVRKIKFLFEEAMERKTGIYFYF